MVDDRINFKTTEQVEEALAILDKYQVFLPAAHEEMTGDVLSDKLETISQGLDNCLRLEREFTKDLSYVKSLLKLRKTTLKIKMTELICKDTLEIRKSFSQKQVDAEAYCAEELREISELESNLDILEAYLLYIRNKRSDYKQKNSDAKLLYKAYLVDREIGRPPATEPTEQRLRQATDASFSTARTEKSFFS